MTFHNGGWSYLGRAADCPHAADSDSHSPLSATVRHVRKGLWIRAAIGLCFVLAASACEAQTDTQDDASSLTTSAPESSVDSGAAESAPATSGAESSIDNLDFPDGDPFGPTAFNPVSAAGLDCTPQEDGSYAMMCADPGGKFVLAVFMQVPSAFRSSYGTELESAKTGPAGSTCAENDPATPVPQQFRLCYVVVPTAGVVIMAYSDTVVYNDDLELQPESRELASSEVLAEVASAAAEAMSK